MLKTFASPLKVFQQANEKSSKGLQKRQRTTKHKLRLAQLFWRSVSGMRLDEFSRPARCGITSPNFYVYDPEFKSATIPEIKEYIWPLEYNLTLHPKHVLIGRKTSFQTSLAGRFLSGSGSFVASSAAMMISSRNLTIDGRA